MYQKWKKFAMFVPPFFGRFLSRVTNVTIGILYYVVFPTIILLYYGLNTIHSRYYAPT
jgi:hypothetical protein